MIALVGEAFGFGPVSKSVAILKHLGVEDCVCFGTDTALEFFRMNGYDCTSFDAPPSGDVLSREARRWKIDCAVVVLDVEWAERFIDIGLPVFYVDSLGFMWGHDHIQEHPRLHESATYICQDVFGARRVLETHGAHSPLPVGAIVDLQTEAPGEVYETVVNIGGVFTPKNEVAARRYLDWVAALVTEQSRTSSQHPIVLSSQRAVDYFRISHANIKSACLPHERALGLMVQAARVLTAPGLTSMLELSALGVAIHPLPPQNYSQCRIIQECLAGEYVSSSAWSMLASAFSVPVGLPEHVGIEYAQSMMLSFAATDGRIRLANAYRKPPQPVRLTDDFTGAESVATIVRNLRCQGFAN
jgi:hypothetical protein